MLAFLLTGMGARGLNSNEWAHGLNHHGLIDIATLDRAHTDTSKADENRAPELIDQVEHQLFHCIGTLYLLAGSMDLLSWGVSSQVQVSTQRDPGLPLADLEPPFRPPRRFASI